jgi:nitric oxide reductase NorD protein
MFSESFETLLRVHPGVAEFVAARLAEKPAALDPAMIQQLASETLWALTIEASFGRCVAAGYADLVGEVAPEKVEVYRRLVREAGRAGATQGGLMAECLPPVLVYGDADLLHRFRRAWDALAGTGTYALKAPLQALVHLLKSGDSAGSAAYLELLREAFHRDLSYAEARYFTAALPLAALRREPPRRCWQLTALSRLLRTDHRLVEPFLTGLGKGLDLLGQPALTAFIDAALRVHARHCDLAARFLALESQSSRDLFAGLQVCVGVAQVQDRLRRYLQIRTGRAFEIRPLSALPALYAGVIDRDRMVCSDGAAIYVPDEIGRFVRKEENLDLYAGLVRLEASFHEFGTIDFDLEKAVDHYPAVKARFEADPGAAHPEGEPSSAAGSNRSETGQQGSDLDRFFKRFPDMDLAADLFTVFELGRMRHCLQRHYPGLVHRFYPLLRETALAMVDRKRCATVCDGLLIRVALAVPAPAWAHPDPAIDEVLQALSDAFEGEISAESPVEASAELTTRYFETAQASVPDRPVEQGGRPPGRLMPPFGWRPWPNPAADGTAAFGPTARRVKGLFAAAGHTVYTADIRRRLAANAGALTPADVHALLGSNRADATPVEELLRMADPDPAASGDGRLENEPAWRYPEWDTRLADYLQAHVHVREQTVVPDGGDFYEAVLQRHRDLVRRTRTAFERLRPEGLKRLRRWPDGDEFDYRGLVEAWIDRRKGDVPSDRLFVKRVKDRRDVAVLLLADVSRSTANIVPGTDASVLDIEKEAIVVLCEALSVLGDAVAAAGFSGSGRHGVDYFHIQKFGEPLSEAVRGRIGALRPQRNTRMGAAIRHAADQLARAPARVRLLIVLSDGFPNDSGYRGAYAVADTRQALAELSTRHIRFHALTINLPADPKLDELYGKTRHHVISDVRELPERLLRVYSALTR